MIETACYSVSAWALDEEKVSDEAWTLQKVLGNVNVRKHKIIWDFVRVQNIEDPREISEAEYDLDVTG